uniref:Galectin n=1 Tax=Hippocampus comes TaxID=109280 RepID=A0A3Q2XK85_HIPCM
TRSVAAGKLCPGLDETKKRGIIDLGYDSQDLALHFNPRFHDDTDGAVIVCNSKIAGCWGEEKREMHNPLHRGTHVKLTGDMFEVELPDGYEIQFPNRGDMAFLYKLHLLFVKYAK